MASISTTTGLISGINTRDIIDQLMKLEASQKTLVQNRIDSITAQKDAFKTLVTQLTTVHSSGLALARPTTFNAAKAASSNEDVLTATTAAGASPGTYKFQVARLVTAQQSVSQGYTDAASSKVGAGTITIEMGGGEAGSQSLLADLNGGAGVRRGQFRISDRSGASAVIDISNAVTLDDVVKKINTSLNIAIKASVVNDRLHLNDTSGSASRPITVAELGGGTTAADLGILGVGSGVRLTGGAINTITSNTRLSLLNDKRGVRTAGTGNDFRITAKNGNTYDINLATATTVGETIAAINTATGGNVTASIDTATNALKLTDSTGGGAAISVTALNSSNAAKDLGLLGSAGGTTITGKTVLADLNSVLISSLNGGNGLTLGTIAITDRTGASANVNLAGATSLQDVIDAISNQSGINVTAKLNQAGNGIAIVDDSTATANLTIADADGTNSATLLGLNQSIPLTQTQLNGKNLQRQWVHENMPLNDMNGGRGVSAGKFKISAANGTSREFNVTPNDASRLKDIISAINGQNFGVTASINANGDGLLLTDTSGGAGKLKIENVTGTTASDLNIAGTAVATSIDGAFEKTLTVDANDTLNTLAAKVTALSWVKASVISDGSADAPYRLSITAVNTGLAGRVVIDTGATTLKTQSLVNAQDAAVFVGGDADAQPLLVTSSSNTVTGVLPGVTLSLNSVSDSPVNLTIARDVESIVDQVTTFVESFNVVIDNVRDLTKWDADTNKGGLLLGDFTARGIQTQLFAGLQTVVLTAGRYRTFADVGVKLDDDAKPTFDEEKFRAAYATDPDAVRALFTQASTGLGNVLTAKVNSLIDPANGTVVRQTKTLDSRNEQFQDRIESLDRVLEQKRMRLETQFANMESVLAKLQSQQTALGSLSTPRMAA